MASEYITSIIGGGAEQEIKSAIEQLDILAKKIVEIQGAIKDISRSNITGNNNSASKKIEQLDTVTKMQKQMAEMTEKVIALESDLGKQYAATKVALAEQTKAVMDEAKANTESAKAAKAAKEAKEAQALAAKQAVQAAKEAKAAQDAENKAIIETQKNQDANIKTQLRLERSIEQLTKARQREEAEIAKQNSAYEQLKQEYAASAAATKELGTEYFNLQRSGTATAEQLREMGQAVRNASKETLGLHKGLFDIEQATGQSQRNVYNYNALMFETNQLLREAPNFALSARTGFMALSNNLPMFTEQFERASKAIDDTTGKAKGFKGALKDVGASILSWQTLLIVGITLSLQYGDKIFGQSQAMKDAAKANKKYKQSLEEIDAQTQKSNGEAIARITLLTEISKSNSVAMKERIKAVDELQKKYPEYFGQLSKEAILQGNVTDAIKGTTDALLKKAAVEAAEKKFGAASDQVYTLQKRQEQAIKDVTEAQKEYNDAIKSGKGGMVVGPFGTSYSEVAAQNLKSKKDTLSTITDLYNAAKKEQMGYLDDVKKGAALIGDVLFPDKKKKTSKTPDTTNAEIKAMDELAEARARLNKAQIEADASANKAIADNEANILEQRLDAYDAYTQDKIKLYELESGLEITATKDRLDKIAEIEAKDPSKRTAQEKKLLLQKESLSALLETLEKEHQLKLDKITDDAQKGRDAIIVSNIKQQKVIVQQEFDQTQQAIELQVNKHLSALNDSYNKGEISYKEYNRRRKEISADANQDIYKAEVEMLDTMLSQAMQSLTDSNLTPDQKKTLKAKVDTIYKLLAGLHPPESAKQEDTIWDALGFGQKDIESRKQLIAQQIQDLYSSIFQIIDAQRDAYYQKRSAQLDAEKDAIDANAQAEQDAVNSSLLSETEKQQKLAQIQAEQQAKDNAIANQKKQLQRQQAQAEKRDAEFKIAIDGAVAIGKIFANYGWPAGIIPAAIQAALTATQLAVVAAKPIPQYATGTENHPGGLAVVGEKGTELVNLPSGQSFITPAVATVMELPKHTEVIPHQDLLNKAHYDALNKVNMLNHPVSPNDYSQALISSFEKGMNRLEHTIKNKQETHFFWKNGELRKSVNRGGNWTHYVGGN